MNGYSRALGGVCVALCVPGLVVASYLTTVHYAGQPVVCGGVGDCEYVNSSRYAAIHGVPVAALGAAAYASMMALLLVWVVRGCRSALVAAWSVSLAAVAFSGYLTYVEVHVLSAICVYCVASAAIVAAIFIALTPLLVAWMLEDAEPVAPSRPLADG